jgi:hypothetical protein
MLARPQIQRRGIDFIDDRRSEADTSKINSLDVMLTGIASFDSHMIEFWRMKISKLRGSLFAAIGAYYSSEFP